MKHIREKHLVFFQPQWLQILMASLIENIESLLESLEVGCLWCLGEVFGLGGSGTERKAGRGAKVAYHPDN